MRFKAFYLIKIQFLGFRYSGWQIQPGVKTIQSMIHKTLSFLLGNDDFKTLASGRTDAKVSALEFAFELFLPVAYKGDLLADLNDNLPADIKVLSVNEVSDNFEVIGGAKSKTYFYLFSLEGKNHPFCAPLMCSFEKGVDINLMQQAVGLYEGEHYFGNYAYKPSKSMQLTRSVESATLCENTKIHASFFPDKSYIFKVSGKGFLRHQVRMMMGMLLKLGRHQMTLEQFKNSLEIGNQQQVAPIVPSSGLHLESVEF